MNDLTRRSLGALFAGSLVFAGAACGDDDASNDVFEEDVDEDLEEFQEDVEDTGDEVEDTIDENVDIGEDAEE